MGEEIRKDIQSSDLTSARVYSLLLVLFDPYYDIIVVLDKINSALADSQKRSKLRACLDSYSNEMDQLQCVFREAGLEDIWHKYKNIIGSRAGIRSVNR
jgi:hypothetical protein